jgi:hypothetical protein
MADPAKPANSPAPRRPDPRPGAPAPPPAPPPRAEAKAAAPPVSSMSVVGATRTAAEMLLERRPYLKLAFANPYNLSLLVGGLTVAALGGGVLLAAVTLGAEGLWLLHAPENGWLRRMLWDPKYQEIRAAAEAQERAERLKPLAQPERDRVEGLLNHQKEIRRLAEQNRAFTGDLLRGELVKTDRLVQAFIDMAINCARYAQYLDSVDFDELDKDRQRWERLVKAGAENDPQTDIAKKNLAIILRRLDKMKEIRRYLTVARGQLDLIENSFQLIADQIVTMQSPQELSGQLDELLDGVESIRETAADTERMLTAMGIGNVSS